MQNNEKTMKVLALKDVRVEGRSLPFELNDAPLYEVISPGVLKLSWGHKPNDNELVYDVSNLSDGFKERYASKIREIQVTRLIGVPNGKLLPTRITLLPLCGRYAELNSDERKALGSDYVTVDSEENGLKITHLITTKVIPANLHLIVHPEEMDEELWTKLASELFEVQEVTPGVYAEISKDEQEKQFK